MHGNDGGLVGVEINEAIAGGLPGELVCHHLKGKVVLIGTHMGQQQLIDHLYWSAIYMGGQ